MQGSSIQIGGRFSSSRVDVYRRFFLQGEEVEPVVAPTFSSTAGAAVLRDGIAAPRVFRISRFGLLLLRGWWFGSFGKTPERSLGL